MHPEAVSLPFFLRWLPKRGSLRTQLIAWNIVALALLLGLLGIVVRYTVSSYLMISVKDELEKMQRRPPPQLQRDGRQPGRPSRPWFSMQFRPPGFGPRDNFRRGFPNERDHRPEFYRQRGDVSPDVVFGSAGAMRTGPDGPQGYGGQPGFNDHPPRNDQDAPPRPPGDRPGNPGQAPMGGVIFGSGGGQVGRRLPPPGMPWVNDAYFPRSFDLQGRPLLGDRNRPVWDANGFALARKGEEHYSQVTVDDVPLEILSVPLWNRGQIVGVGQAAFPLTEVNRALAGLDMALLTMIPIGLLCAGAGGSYLTDRVLRRVRNTTQAAASISVTGSGDLSERLPVVGNDEFSELADTFNGLLGRLETAFHQQARLLEQQRRFTADASHELKTPLTVIKGTASMALSGESSETLYRRSLQDIDRAANSMSHLVQDLLLLARSDGGQLGKNRIELLVREVLELAKAGVVKQTAVPINLQIEDEALTVVGNEMELVRLFTNLLDNAVRYSQAGGTVTVTASTARDDPEPQTLVQVVDTGVGISPEHLPHLGERFYRVDASRARPDGGTGLGLSICKSIVEANQGQMTIESAPGKGTTVRVLLSQTL